MINVLKNILRFSPYAGDIDSSQALEWHRRLILEKPFLKRLYIDFYREIGHLLPVVHPTVLEIGSGGGFIKEVLPQVITSDIKKTSVVDQVFSATNLPFQEGSLDAIVMLNVFHHLQAPEECLKSFDHCLRRGGKIIMIEPANTPWRRWVDKHFHNEPFDAMAGWEIVGDGPMSAANGALPWIVFSRDRKIFQQKFPHLKVKRTRLHTTFGYLISGGLSYNQLLPLWMYPVVRFLENCLTPLMPWTGYFQTIEIEKN